ncbi:MAG: S53 family peptidase [Actinomycetota bacterium]|nr:S53 family peptidase [Actinomycetota bacterium]
MDFRGGAGRARAATAAVLLACAVSALGAQPAAAAPRLGTLLSGLHIDLGCANPANHGLLGRVLSAARVNAGGPLRCFSQAVADRQGLGPKLMAGPTGLGPAQIQSAYKLTGLSAGGRTVAIVDAFDDPKAAADLNSFRSAYGLPACTTANGCFRKINQTGASSPLPAGDYGWAEEISLDLDAVSSACPTCQIVLVEAKSANTPDLVAAEDAAARTGAVAISNSYGGAEDSTILAADAHFNHPGVAITASSGDSGYGVSWPASSPYVTGVGGTTLSAAGNARGWTETAWSGSGSGCSAYEPKPSWQHDPSCAKRTVADVSADANPSSGLGVYDTYNSCGSNSICDLLIGLGLVQGLDGWAQVGGTSLSSPLIASVYALAGNAGGVTYGSYPYAHSGALNDVTSGSNGTCAATYLCTAVPGYDGPTGLGTPIGTGAF